MERVFIRPIQSLIRSSPVGSRLCEIITGLLIEKAAGTLGKVNDFPFSCYQDKPPTCWLVSPPPTMANPSALSLAQVTAPESAMPPGQTLFINPLKLFGSL